MKITKYSNPTLNTWTPYSRVGTLRDDMNQLFDSLFGDSGGTSEWFGGWNPSVDVFQDDNQVTVNVELPGLKKEDIGISLHDGVLTVSGERHQEKDSGAKEAYRSERFYGKFQRSVSLPTDVQADKVTASYKDGILAVNLPKAEEAKPKRIEISVK